MDELDEQLEQWLAGGGRLVRFDWDGIPEGQWLMLPGPSLAPQGRAPQPRSGEERRSRSAKKRRKRL